jgi:hypothetical protein
MSLLITEITEQVEYVTEEKDGVKSHFIQGIFLQSEIQNRNGRRYPLDTMMNEVNRYTTETIQKGRAYGELGHPQGPAINLDRVSHMITELKQDGNNFIGKAKLTETPMGDIARGLLKSGANLGVSSRGMGTLKSCKEGVMEVQSDFRLATAADIVADPSAPDAFVKGILEGVDWVYNASNDSWHQERLENTAKALKQTKQIDEAAKFRMFKNFLDSLAKS